jgi:hypothetical protein
MRKANILDIDDMVPIWRVFRPEYLLNDIKNRRLTLVRPSSWDDPFENFLEKCKFRLPTGEAVNASPVLNRFFGQCWTTLAEETDATWRIYSTDKAGVRVRSVLYKVGASMWDGGDEYAALKYFVGRGNYVPVEFIDASLRHRGTFMLTGNGGLNLVRSLLVKWTEFSHEQEARVLFYDFDDKFRNEKLWSCPIDPNAIFEEAVFDPRMPEQDVTEWTQRLRDAGFTGSIAQSTLYRPPSWEITLS